MIARRSLNVSRSLFNNLNRRHAGHWLHKNIRVEENAGLREGTIHEFKFDFSNLRRLFLGFFLPLFIIYEGSKTEMVII